MNELINIEVNENQQQILSGRELHGFLEIGSRYNDWFNRMKEYGFVENVDFIAITQKRATAQGNETTYIDHAINIDMAKELSMIQRSEKGKQARLYFLELEKAWNTPESVMARALKMADTKMLEYKNNIIQLEVTSKKQQQIIGELKPKADYTDRILKNKGLVTITQISKDYGLSGQALNKRLHELKVQYKQSNQWLLYREHQGKGYTHSETIDITRKDGSADITMNTKWTQKGRLFLYEVLKDNGILPDIEKAS